MEVRAAWELARRDLDKEVRRSKLKGVELSGITVHEFSLYSMPGPPALLFQGDLRAEGPGGEVIVSRFLASPGAVGIDALAGPKGLDELRAFLKPGPGTPFDP